MPAIFRAVAVSDAIGRIARPAIARPARLASRVPPSTPAAMKSQSRSIGRVDVGDVAAVLDVAGDAPGLPWTRSSVATRIVTASVTPGAGRPEVLGAGAVDSSRLPSTS